MPDTTKLSTIKHENGRRFITIYVEPDGNIPDVEKMINDLVDIQPDRNLCLRALQMFNYNIEQATEHLVNEITNGPSVSNTQNSNKNAHNDGKPGTPAPNQFVFTLPSQSNSNKSNPYGLTDEEVKLVRKEKPDGMNDDFAFELFISASKDIQSFRTLVS